MEPKTSNQDQWQEIEQLPEQLQQWCLAGKSVSQTAHLVKNIIQMVSGSAEIIDLGMKKKQYPRVQKSWSLFEPSLRRLLKYVLDLIKYTRHYPTDKSDCNINQLITHSIQHCEAVLKQYPVTIESVADETLESVTVDTEQIQEMLCNLIMHAMDNLSDHAGTIRIETNYLKNHQQVQISVCDDGPGLNNDTIRTLGEPKERIPNMCGTGFEIALATIYIEQHDGYIEFESAPDKGNCVHVYLPMQ